MGIAKQFLQLAVFWQAVLAADLPQVITIAQAALSLLAARLST